MNTWKYYDVRHKRHLICNPMNKEKFERLCRLLTLKLGAHVLDIACGKGEFLVRLAELYDITGVGVDISPYCIKDCIEKHRKRVPNSDIRFMEMDGANYKPESSVIFDLAACVGASWVYGGYRETIRTLKSMIKPDGLVVVGEPFWLKEPSEEYLKVSGTKKEEFGTHQSNVRIGEEEGLICIYTLVSDLNDWDHYESLKWSNVYDFVKANPDDKDIPELLERTLKQKERYLCWERDELGWAIYVFRKGHWV